MIDDQAYRDVTDDVTAAAAERCAVMGHDAYKRVRRRMRQVRHG
jgi:hypothetical protein